MTDKEQIIIDGVDIGKCTLYGEGRCNNACNPLNCLFCSDKPNCHYKQLARKTQECEELKEKNALLESQMAFNLSEVEIKLGNETNRNETLLKELKRFDKIKDEFREMSEKLKTENTRYRKALEEIEKATKINCEEICGRKFEDCNDFLCSSKNILDIINKAKDGKNDNSININ